MINSGENFGRYRIQTLLGKGGMGRVYLARDPDLDRFIALKLLPAEISGQSEQIRRLSREARTASALNHPNIITIYEIGEANGLNYIASEYVKGQTLGRIIKKDNLTLEEILDLSIQILSAINAAHQAQIIHRDIKPDNLMVRVDNIVKILDFGLAKLVKKTQIENPASSKRKVIGTPHYMSPEQAEGQRVDPRTDIWSFGVVFYEMLTGTKPFVGETIAEIILSILYKEPQEIDTLREKYPTEITKIVTNLLQKDQKNRYQNAAEVLNALEKLKNQIELKKEFRKLDAQSRKKIESAVIENEYDQIPNNLRQYKTSLIGREKELTEVCDLLTNEDVRMVTLKGIGGTGKTALSQAVAQKLLPSFPDGVYFIELAAITDPDLVISEITQTLGIRETGDIPITEDLKFYLEDKQILLILDNFEQVTEAATFISEILSSDNHLKILVSSRELLRLSIENEFEVQPLKTPIKNSKNLSENEAVKLFIERARKVQPNFVVSEENLQSIAEICIRLEGLPLAIEFAAARCRLLSPSAILKKLESRLQLLTSGSKDLPERRKTMRGAIEWSYDLLTENEKMIFRRLAIFNGGFTIDAVESVITLEKDNLKLDILEGVTNLLDKSLISVKENSLEAPRFTMLEVVREYALEVLEENFEKDSLQEKHAIYFLAIGEQAEHHMTGRDSTKWLNLLETEIDNFRLTLRWLLENAPEKGIRLTAAIRYFWLMRTHLTEGSNWINIALGKGIFISNDIRFNLLNALGWLSLMRSQYKKARKLFEEMLLLSSSAQDREKIATSKRGLANTMQYLGDFETARKLSEEELQLSRQLGDKKLIGNALSSLGNLALLRDDLENSRIHFEEGLVIAKEINHEVMIHSCLFNLATVAFYQKRYQESESLYKETLEISRKLGNKIVISYVFDGFAALSLHRKNLEKAAKLAGVAETIRNLIAVKPELIEQKFRDSYLSKLRSALPADEFNKNYEIGCNMDTDKAYSLVLPGE
jgi:non-specific serine/threonine protein kinase